MEHSEDKEKNTKFKKGDEANSTSLSTHTHKHTLLWQHERATTRFRRENEIFWFFLVFFKYKIYSQIQNLTLERVQTVAWAQDGKFYIN